MSLVVILSVCSKVSGQEIAGQSASISYSINSTNKSCVNKVDYAKKKKAIATILEKYHSPLAGNTDDFISACSRYNLDCYLLPSIAGLESTFGHYILAGSSNPFGWDGGNMRFTNWSEAIDTVGRGLKENYVNRGLTSVEAIGGIYSESPTWAIRVKNFMKQFNDEEQKMQLYLSLNSVQ